MPHSSVVSSKGQITVPQEVRTQLGLKEGDRVEFVMENGHTVMRPARASANPFEPYAGALGTFPGGADEIEAWVNEMREAEPSK